VTLQRGVCARNDLAKIHLPGQHRIQITENRQIIGESGFSASYEGSLSSDVTFTSNVVQINDEVKR